MLKISLNGVEQHVKRPMSVAALLAENGYAERKVAVEINREIVPKSMHAERVIHDGDEVEIVQALGGG
jgi:sulfur carrier protein